MKAASADRNQTNNQKQPSENSVKITNAYYFAQIGLKLEKRIEITSLNFESFIRHVAVYNHKSH